jgi:dipeptidyl-peptidase-4
MLTPLDRFCFLPGIRPLRGWLPVCCLLIAFPCSHRCQAQTAGTVDWDQLQQRLKGIYERGEWQAARFEGDWFPDSSGYRVRRRQNGEDRPMGYEVRTGQPVSVPEIETPRALHSPDGSRVLEFRGRRLYWRDLPDGEPQLLIRPPDGREVFYRNPTWSPDGQKVLFIESDETEVRKRSMLVPSDPSYPAIREQRFARVGEKIPKLRVAVYEVATQQTRWLPLVDTAEGFYLSQVEWAPQSSQDPSANKAEVLVERLSRFRDCREFLLFDAGNDPGNHPLKEPVRTLFRETNEAWVDSSTQKNLRLIWIRGGQQFIVISEKAGWRQAFLYDRNGEELGVLTPGEYDLIERGVVDEAQGWFYFYASPTNATQKYLYRVPLDGSGRLERITPADQAGTHDYQFSPDARWAFHTRSTFDTPPITELVQLPDHQTVRVLEDNAPLQGKSESLQQNPVEFLRLEIEEGLTLDAWLLKPRDFEPTKKYPVFVYVYGEPHAQTVLDGWATVHDQFHRAVADLGYLVISIDNRGTPAPKGAAWRRSVFGSLGPLSTEEQAAALETLAQSRPYVDLSRVGIWGWSGGGSNTLNAMFRKPELYQVGIAVVPKPQPHLYNAWFQEIFMRTVELNPEGYQQSAALNFAEGLRGKLLIITGSGETNTHIQIIEGLVDRLIELGKSFDYMVYPNRDHGLSEGPGTVVHVRMLVIRYLVEHLPPGGR